MKIGIKYCGGCNPKYNRGEAVKQIIDRYPEMEFENVKPDIFYDYILIINGCDRGCAEHEGLKTNKKIFINSLEEVEALHDKFKK